MKTKRTFYLVMIITGAGIAGLGSSFMEEEYALCVGIVLLMFGLYKTTQLWSLEKYEEEGKDKENN